MGSSEKLVNFLMCHRFFIFLMENFLEFQIPDSFIDDLNRLNAHDQYVLLDGKRRRVVVGGEQRWQYDRTTAGYRMVFFSD